MDIYNEIFNLDIEEKEYIDNLFIMVSLYRNNFDSEFDNVDVIREKLLIMIEKIKLNDRYLRAFAFSMKYILNNNINFKISTSEYILFNIYISYLYGYNKYNDENYYYKLFEYLCNEVINNMNYNIFSYMLFKIIDSIYLYNKNLEDEKNAIIIKSLNEKNEYWDQIKKDKTIIWN